MQVPVRCSVVLHLALLGGLMAAESQVDPFEHAEVEVFLREAKIVDRAALPIGVTHSSRVTLSDGTTTMQAVWKTIDDNAPVKRFDHGLPELGFTDSYKNEIAAYRLSELLGLDLVPPTVQRRIGRRTGSMQLWMDGCITEAKRYKEGLQPPDSEAWTRQVYNVRLFRQLIHDTDFRNASNILVDADFRLWSIDHSRGFRSQETLLDSDYLRRFSRSVLDRLRELDEENLKRSIGSLLSKGKRKAILERRDLILARASEVIDERGEEAVLFP